MASVAFRSSAATASAKGIQIPKKKALTSIAPREKQNARKRDELEYLFNSISDLRKCLEEGTFVFNCEIKDSDFAKTNAEFYNINIKGSYSNHGEGIVKVCLQDGDKLMLDEVTNRIFYYFNNQDRKEARIQSESDSEEDYNYICGSILESIQPVIEAVFPQHTFTPFYPDHLKMMIPKNKSYRKKKEGGFEVTDSKTPFNLDEFAALPGLYVVSLGQVWVQKGDRKGILQSSAGVSAQLCKQKKNDDEDVYLHVPQTLKPLGSKMSNGTSTLTAIGGHSSAATAEGLKPSEIAAAAAKKRKINQETQTSSDSSAAESMAVAVSEDV